MTHPQDSLAGQVAVVTGAGRGIGKAIALTFGQAGATVVACARTSDEVETTPLPRFAQPAAQHRRRWSTSRMNSL